MINFLFPNPPVEPIWFRNTVSIALVAVLLLFVIGSLFISYHPILIPLSRVSAVFSTALNIVAITGFVGLAFLRRKDIPEPGGWLYIAFLLMMLLWWGTSLVREGRVPITGLLEQPTFATQALLTSLAAALIILPFGTIQIGPNVWWWLASIVLFFLAMVVMVADTDYHHFAAVDPITRNTWLIWRMWNYGLIVPYLLLALCVLHGMPLSYAAGAGLLAATFLFVATLFQGGTV